MKTYQMLVGAALAGGLVGGHPAVFGQGAPAGLKVYTSIEVEFVTETNRYYALQGSADLQSWSAIGEPVFGNGQVIRRMFSTRSGEQVSFGTYRLAVVESTNVSFAPWDVAGRVLSLSDDSGTDLYRFATSTNGFRHASGDDAFAYTLSKTAENVAELSMVLPEGRSNHVTLQFSAEGQGTFVLEQYRDARLKGRDLGTFTLASAPTLPTDPGTGGSTPTPPEPPTPPSVPVDLAGRAFSFSAGGEPDRLEFLSATNGVELEDRVKFDDDGGRKPFTYTYAVTTATNASLKLDFGRGRSDEYDLTFTVGEQGSFVRRELRDGAIHDIDHGRFSAAGAVAAPGSGDDNSSNNSSNGTPTGGSTGGTSTGTDTDYWNHGVAPEPGDDKGGQRPDPSTDSSSGQGGSGGNNNGSTGGSGTGGTTTGGGSGTIEPGDDKGGHGAEPGDDHGSTTVEPGDDKGGTGVEPGDDKGGGTTVEPGDDKGGTTPEPGDDKGTGVEPGDDKGTGVEPGDDKGTGVEPGDDKGNDGSVAGGTGSTPTDPTTTPAPTPTAPVALTGLNLNFGSDVYRFGTATTGIKIGSSSSDPFAYEYVAAAGGVATVKVTVKSDRWFEFTLTFALDGKGGTYLQREFRSGSLKAEKQGNFSVVP